MDVSTQPCPNCGAPGATAYDPSCRVCSFVFGGAIAPSSNAPPPASGALKSMRQQYVEGYRRFRRVKWYWQASVVAIIALFALAIVGAATDSGGASDNPSQDANVAAATGQSQSPAAVAVVDVVTATQIPSTPTIAIQPSATATIPLATATPVLAWEQGAPISESAVRARLQSADGLSRGVDLGNPQTLAIDGATITLTYKPKIALGETDMLTVSARTTFGAMRAMLRNPLIQSVTVVMLGDWIDPYGQTAEEETTRSTLSRSTVDLKIAWDGLATRVTDDNKHMFCISDSYFIHPGIYSRLDDKGCLLFHGASY